MAVQNVVITCMAMGAGLNDGLADNLIKIWPVLGTIFTANVGYLATYVISGSSETKHSNEMAAKYMYNPAINPSMAQTINSSLNPARAQRLHTSANRRQQVGELVEGPE